MSRTSGRFGKGRRAFGRRERSSGRTGRLTSSAQSRRGLHPPVHVTSLSSLKCVCGWKQKSKKDFFFLLLYNRDGAGSADNDSADSTMQVLLLAPTGWHNQKLNNNCINSPIHRSSLKNNIANVNSRTGNSVGLVVVKPWKAKTYLKNLWLAIVPCLGMLKWAGLSKVSANKVRLWCGLVVQYLWKMHPVWIFCFPVEVLARLSYTDRNLLIIFGWSCLLLPFLLCSKLKIKSFEWFSFIYAGALSPQSPQWFKHIVMLPS